MEFCFHKKSWTFFSEDYVCVHSVILSIIYYFSGDGPGERVTKVRYGWVCSRGNHRREIFGAEQGEKNGGL